jgi:hypothetical protein
VKTPNTSTAGATEGLGGSRCGELDGDGSGDSLVSARIKLRSLPET